MKTNELMEECRKRFSSPKMDKIIDLHIETLEKAYNTGYNDACEKILEYIKEKSLYSGILRWPDIIKELKQALYPYNIE